MRMWNRLLIILELHPNNYPDVTVSINLSHISQMYTDRGYDSIPTLQFISHYTPGSALGRYQFVDDIIDLFPRQIWESTVLKKGWLDIEAFRARCAETLYHELRHGIQSRRSTTQQKNREIRNNSIQKRRVKILQRFGYFCAAPVLAISLLVIFRASLVSTAMITITVILLSQTSAKLIAILWYYFQPDEIDARRFARKMMKECPDDLLDVTIPE